MPSLQGSTSQIPILVFTRAPVPGRVKRRLVPILGAQGAADLHRFLLGRVLRAAAAAGGPAQLWATEAGDPFLRLAAWAHGMPLRQQPEGDLGARMAAALAHATATRGGAVLVGSDFVDVTADELRAAREALAAGEDAVFTPTADGGYRLVGLRRPGREPFEGVEWGGERVMTQTRTRLRTLGWSWRELSPGWDVDRPEDLARLRAVPGLPAPVRRLLDAAA